MESDCHYQMELASEYVTNRAAQSVSRLAAQFAGGKGGKGGKGSAIPYNEAARLSARRSALDAFVATIARAELMENVELKKALDAHSAAVDRATNVYYAR